MAIKHSRTDGVLDIQLEGRIDSRETPQLEQELNAVLQPGDRAVILNLRQLEYINSAGMRTILGLVSKLKSRDAKFAIYSPVGPVKEVFQLSGFSRVMAIHASRDEALAAVTD